MSIRKKHIRITVVGLVLVVLLPVLVAMANGQDDSSAEDGWSRDVQSYAGEYDVTADEAAKRLRLQDEVGQLDSRLIAGEPATFGGIWIEHTPTFKVRAAFTENGAETLGAYEQSADLQAVLETVVAGSSLVDLGSARDLAQAAVSRTGNRADFALNVPGNVVHIYTLDADGLKEDLADARETLSPKVVIKEVNQLVTPTHGLKIHGGESLTGCTSGFSVVHTGGDRGILTAAHCDRDRRQ